VRVAGRFERRLGKFVRCWREVVRRLSEGRRVSWIEESFRNIEVRQNIEGMFQ
jgi:hypothetical protein